MNKLEDYWWNWWNVMESMESIIESLEWTAEDELGAEGAIPFLSINSNSSNQFDWDEIGLMKKWMSGRASGAAKSNWNEIYFMKFDWRCRPAERESWWAALACCWWAGYGLVGQPRAPPKEANQAKKAALPQLKNEILYGGRRQSKRVNEFMEWSEFIDGINGMIVMNGINEINEWTTME